MVFLDAFSLIMPELVSCGLAHPAGREGEIPLEVTVISDTCTLCLHAREIDTRNGQEQTICWRVLVQEAVVEEARKALNLFQLRGSPPPVPQDAAVSILADAWRTASAACSALSPAQALSELFLAARFLLLNGHEVLPDPWSLRWDPPEEHAILDKARGAFEGRRLLLQVPQEVFASLPGIFSADCMVEQDAKRSRLER
mmetsp:Transcript_153745/g.267457  ORF Transcript_153745/g.267457 Transcript_153745/m.267457 type:complete len:199 (+) Transcript_153745:1-597(+)